MSKIALVGPWGYDTGRNWSFTLKGKLTKITINHGDCINSISFTCQDEDGNVFHSQKFGGSGGDISEVDIDIDDEELNEISGTFDDRDSRMVVTSLSFSTNENRFGPFGRRKGTKFSLPLADGHFVGFYGRYSEFLHAIGFYLRAA